MKFARIACLTLTSIAALNSQTSHVMAEVQVIDGSRLDKETNTRVCMERSRTYKQRAEQPTDGIRGSFATPGSAQSAGFAGTGSVGGGAFSGNAVGGVDLSALFLAAGTIAALKAKTAGEASNAINAATLAIIANQAALAGQSGTIGSAETVQGSFDQNTGLRLSGAHLWNQSIETANTTLKLRNQALADEAAASSKAARIWGGSTAPKVELPDNIASTPTVKSSFGAVSDELEAIEDDASSSIVQ